ncbi:hypothetical protein SCHPADRAFT_538494 [Schizopora paradoxa]|uniref:Golgi apparatus membrane protein TVP38 n=1 Tax=Schizopora paradoxa TaxID=27342 RepID=A0A0H2RE13_9AGAM|nr:hypothetical protein SCHPADRAFT_538494 [Schizopora paradoxa]
MEPPSYFESDSSLNIERTVSDVPPRIVRTPSPSPSEVIALKEKGIFNVRATIRRSSKRQKICIYLTIVILLLVAIVLALLHDLIVAWLLPAAIVLRSWKGGWLIPVGILSVMSFPPFVGQELIMIVSGIVWGLWVGFAIAAGGTLLGEIANFFVFNNLCRERGGRYERTRIDYGCLARVVREGGLKVAVIARYSFIPPHFTTVVFATCGLKFWIFLLSAFLSLPRHFITVYIGVTLDDEAKHKSKTTKEKIITYVVLIVTVVVSVVALRYINKLSDKIKGDVIYQRRKHRQAKGDLVFDSYSGNDSTAVAAEEIITTIHLTPRRPSESYCRGREDASRV